MANERLYQFPSKATPVPADIIYAGDSAAAFDEVNITISALIGAYPNLLGIGGLSLSANTFIYSNNSAVLTAGAFTALAVSLVADSTTSAMQTTLGYTATPAASLFAGWDANINLSANSFISAYATTATAASTTTLTVASKFQQFFTGTTTQTVLLPVTSTLVLGQAYYIVNNSTGTVTVQSSGGNTIQAMASNTTLLVTCILTSGTTAASWYADYNFQTALTLPLSLANGGTNASLTASNGGIVYSSASALGILAGTATAGQLLLSGLSTTPAWSTSTYPATNAVNTLLYASSANVMAALATANSSVLVTSAGGVPSWSTTLPSGISASGMILTSPKIITSLLDTNGNTMMAWSPAGSSVNYVTIFNAATANSPGFQAAGSDSNVAIALVGKGTSGCLVGGFTDASAGTAGYVGQVITSNIPAASATSLTNNTNKDVTSISLTAGDWDVYGNVFFQANTAFQAMQVWINTTSATYSDLSTVAAAEVVATSTYGGLNAPSLRVNVSTTTTVYLSCLSTFGAGTCTACGTLFARRRR